MYFLMNKDDILAEFYVLKRNDIHECVMTKQFKELPWFIKDINTFVKQRLHGIVRPDVHRYLDTFDMYQPETIIERTRCLSMRDTLWVKAENDIIDWVDVSYFRRTFSTAIHTPVLTAGLLNMDGTWPELSTGGDFDKCWVTRDDGQYLLKACGGTASYCQLEPYNEVLVSPLFEKLARGVHYSLTRINDRMYSTCKSFTDEECGFVEADMHCYKWADLDAELRRYKYLHHDAIKGFIIASAITVNPYRTFDFGLEFLNDTFELLGVCQPHDYNRAMFPDLSTYEADIGLDEALNRVNDLNKHRNHMELAKDLIDDEIRAELINLKDMWLEVPEDDTFTRNRINICNEFKNKQIDRLLGDRKVFSVIGSTKRVKMSIADLLSKAEGMIK